MYKFYFIATLFSILFLSCKKESKDNIYNGNIIEKPDSRNYNYGHWSTDITPDSLSGNIWEDTGEKIVDMN